jgi:hypothetical protein
MKCPRCGLSIPDDSDICPKCGVYFARKVLTSAPKESPLSTYYRKNWIDIPTTLKIRQTRNSLIMLVIVGLILVALSAFYIVNSKWEFRDPEFAYSVIGGMIGACFGGAILLKLRINRLENDLAKKKMSAIKPKITSTRKVVRIKQRK